MAVEHFDSNSQYVAPARSGLSRAAAWLETVWAPRVLSLVRFVTGLMFVEHGTQKFFDFPPLGRPGPALFSLYGYQGTIELVGGLLLAFGLFTGPVALILAGDMAVAYFMSHAPRGFFPVLNGGDAAILYCFIFFYFVFAGGGAWSLDRAIRKKT